MTVKSDFDIEIDRRVFHYHPAYKEICCGDSTGVQCTNPKDVTCPKCKELAKEKVTLHFPRVKFADINSIRQQCVHVISEAKEAQIEDIPELKALELWDVIHSAETALLIMERDYQIDLAETKQKVIHKNRARNYYG